MVEWYRGLGDVHYNPSLYLPLPEEALANGMSPSAAQLVYLQPPAEPPTWGNLRYVAAQAFIAVQIANLYKHADNSSVNVWRQQGPVCFALQQLQLMIGGSGKSYVIGVGPSSPCRVHHRGASCPADRKLPCDCTALWNPGCNPNVLAGGLVGGPGNSATLDDTRMNFRQNEPALDYNAGFAGEKSGWDELLYE